MNTALEVQGLAQEIRSVYITARRRHEERRTGRPSNYLPGNWWDGGRTRRSGVKRKNYWLALAKQFQEKGIDPAAFIDFVFSQWSVNWAHKRQDYAPQPNILGSKSWQEKFLEYRKSGTSEERCRRAFKAQQAAAKQAILKYESYDLYEDEQAVLRAVLCDSSLSLSALFRYCFAVKAGQGDVAAFYHTAAKKQFAKSPEVYLEQWGDWLPEEFSPKSAIAWENL